MSGFLGATIVLMDEFKPEAFLEHVARYGVTTTAVVPTMLHRVMALGPRCSRGTTRAASASSSREARRSPGRSRSR